MGIVERKRNPEQPSNRPQSPHDSVGLGPNLLQHDITRVKKWYENLLHLA